MTNDLNKEKLSQLPFFFSIQYIENPKGKKNFTEISISYQSNNSKTLKHLHIP